MAARRSRSTALVVVRLAKTLEIVLADVGLTFNQFRLLTLVEDATVTPGELSTRLVMKPPNVTAMINSLADRGLIRRSRSDDDARRTRLHLTRRGDALVGRAHAACDGALQHLAAGAEGDRAEQLLTALDRWLPALDAAAIELRKGLNRAGASATG
jgi:DNA-binding MarR family transcriptional regulator